MRKIVLLFATMIFALHLQGWDSEGKSLSGKPLSPVKISISPVRSGLSSQDMRAGDAVEFKITAVPLMDAKDMQIKIELSDEVKLIAGETAWSGSLLKNEEKTLSITVSVPLQKEGRIKAQAVISLSEGASFSSTAVYEFGDGVKNKTITKPSVRKDSEGRDIIEYRIKPDEKAKQ